MKLGMSTDVELQFNFDSWITAILVGVYVGMQLVQVVYSLIHCSSIVGLAIHMIRCLGRFVGLVEHL